MYKRSFGTRVYIIADKFSIEQTAVNRIINSYISVCRQDLLNGYEIRILGFVNLIPDNKQSDFIKTLAFYCKKVSEQTNYPYHTCLSVIKEYLSSSKEDLLSGQSIDIRSIVSLHPLERDGQLVKIHASISTSIKSDLQELNGAVFSVRAHTCKLLKYNISTLLCNNQSDDTIDLLDSVEPNLLYDYS